MSIDQTVSDFDGVLFHISTPEAKSKIVVSIQIKCYGDLVKYGAEQVLQRGAFESRMSIAQSALQILRQAQLPRRLRQRAPMRAVR